MTPAHYATVPDSAVTNIKRKKSRPYIDPDEYEESDGAQADAEFGSGSGLSGWINIEGRRKSTVHGHGHKVTSAPKKIDGDEARRRSMAV